MHKSPWKLAFFMLLGLNILFALFLFTATRPKEDMAEKSGEGARFSIDKTFNFTVPVEAYGFKSQLIVRALPSVTSDGRMRMAIQRVDLGRLPLPEEASLALFSRVINREGMAVDVSRREIRFDPAALFEGAVEGDFRVKELNVKEDRYVFEGQLGVS